MDSRLYLKDPLTGVYSRASLQQRLQEEAGRAARYHEAFSLLLIDLDHFKSVNDAFGHSRGDDVLIEFSRRVQNSVRSADVLFRYGGDEFLLLLPQTPKKLAVPMAQRLLDIIRSQPYSDSPPLTVSASIGVSSFPDDGLTPEILFDRADQRNYEAKRRGRGRVISENPSPEGEEVFEEVSRLLERDDAVRVLHRFLEKIPANGHGVLLARGKVGAGRSRFLVEAGRAARLQGYEVFTLRGSLAARGRAYAPLAEAFRDWNLTTLQLAEDNFRTLLFRWIAMRDRCGLFLVADDLAHTDWATREWLYSLMHTPSPIPIGLAYAASNEEERLFTALDGFPYSEIINLRPLSANGLHIWLRGLLHWEPPADFVNWLMETTQGYPGKALRALKVLVEQAILQKVENSWELLPRYVEIDLQIEINTRETGGAGTLPAPATAFIGRDREIALVRDALTRSRLLTLTGPGGVGKTRLAIQAAAESAGMFQHGVYFVALAPVQDSQWIPSAIAEALKLGLYSGAETQAAQVLDYLREKSLLLVLDNLEHLLDGSQFIADILTHAPNVHILATSREVLNLVGETVLTLEGMEFPRGGASLPLELYGAAQLFVHYARQIYPRFALGDSDRPHIARICRLVEGIPLGIELAAAWIRTMTCEEIADETERSKDFLATTLRDMPDRHRSLRAVFESSWQLLKEEERRAYANVAVFRGGFTRNAAERVAGANFTTLSSLVLKSLLYRAPDGRYQFHEVLHEYAAQKLAEDAESNTRAHAAHTEYFSHYLYQREDNLEGRGQNATLDEIRQDVENIRSAWQEILHARRWDLLEKMVSPWCHYFNIRGLHTEGDEAFQSAGKAVEQELAAIKPETANQAGDERLQRLTFLLARIHSRLATFYLRKSQLAAARKLLESSLVVFEKQESEKELARCYRYLSWLEESLGNYTQADALCQISLDYSQKAADWRGTALILNQLGVIYYHAGNYEKAYQTHIQSLGIFTAHGENWGMGRALTNIGNVQAQLGDFEAARQSYRQSLKIAQQLGDRSGESVLANNLGDIEREQGNYPEAERLLELSIETCKEIGDREGAALSMGNLADIARKQGMWDKARHLLQQGLEIYTAIGSPPGIGYIHNQLAALALAEGRPDSAREHLSEAFRIVRNQQAMALGSDAALTLAHIHASTGNRLEALSLAFFVRKSLATLHETRGQAEVLIAESLSLVTHDERVRAEENAERWTIETIAQALLDAHRP